MALQFQPRIVGRLNQFPPRPAAPAPQGAVQNPPATQTQANALVGTVRTWIANHPVLCATAVGGLAASLYTGSNIAGAATAGAIYYVSNKFFAAMNTPPQTHQPRVAVHAPVQAPQTAATGLAARFAFFARHYGFIWFYKKQENPETEVFGNFYMGPLTHKGRTYQCAEAAFQAQKFEGNPTMMAQFENLDGDAAWRLARQLTGNPSAQQKAAWDSKKFHVMAEVLQAKFQDPALRSLLLATGSAYLVEHCPQKGRDTCWSDDFDGTGQNNLGKLLMDLRRNIGGTGRVNPPSNYLQNATRLK